METTEFTYRQYRYEKKKGVKDNAKVFGQSDWGDGVAITETKTLGRAGLGEIKICISVKVKMF